MKIGPIKFNVTQRGRKFRGEDRNFDTVALASLVNGGDVQERVKNRDLVGYFGHWPRVMFGISPGEGGIHDGKQVTLEPALITTKLTAQPDGTIEHEAEFLDTAPGRTVRRLFASKAGGFSSAIAVREVDGGRDVPIAFHGFDYVMEPNFSTNRGYALDGVRPADGAVLDDAMRETQATIKILDGLYSDLQRNFDMQALCLSRMSAENAELVDMLARGKIDPKQAKLALSRLDSAAFTLPTAAARLDDASLMRSAREFDSIELPGFAALPSKDEGDVKRLQAMVHGFFSRGRP